MNRTGKIWWVFVCFVSSMSQALSQSAEADLIFPQIADGEGIQIEIALTNPGAREDSGTIYFEDGAGNGLFLEIGGKERDSLPYSVKPGGVFRVRTEGGGDLKTGYAFLVSDLEDSTLTGNITYSLFGRDVSVPDSPQSTQYHVFSESNLTADCGVALVNLNGSAISISAFLLSQDGKTLDEKLISLEPGAHSAKFITEIFDGVEAGFLGSVHLHGNGAFSMVGLRQKTNGSFALVPGSTSALPTLVAGAARSDQGGRGALVFPQVVEGGGIRCEIILTNPGGSPESGQITFKSQNGDPMSIHLDGEERESIPFLLPAGGVSKFETDGSGDLKVGYATVESQGGPSNLTGTVIYTLDPFEVSVPASPMASRYHVLAESGPGVSSGLALANPGARSLQVVLVLRDEDGKESGEVRLDLEAGEQRAQYIDEWFENLAPEFTGSLHSYADQDFALLGLRQRDGGSLSTLAGSNSAFRFREQSVEYLRAFAKLYGYVRFFHPSDEATQIDWDRFAVYGAEKVKAANSSEELKQILEEAFLPIAPDIQIYLGNANPAANPRVPEQSGLKEVSWQHQGVDLGFLPSDYRRSIRTNRESPSDDELGNVTQSISASGIQGRRIRLVAYARTELSNPESLGGLWLQADLPNGQVVFFDNLTITAPNWARYEISGEVDSAASIRFGSFLLGRGKLWVDDFEISVSEDGSSWTPVPIANPGFEESTAGPLGWWAGSQGYFYGIEQSGAFSGSQCLLIEYPGRLFDQTAQPGEAIKQEIGAGLYCDIPMVLMLDEEAPEVWEFSQSFHNLASELAKIDLVSLTGSSEDARLAAVVVVWSVLQHFYPYFDVVDVDWDSQLTLALQRAFEDKGAANFKKTLQMLVVALRDGHGVVRQAELDAEYAYFPVSFSLVEGEIVVTASTDLAGQVQAGDILLSVDGVDSGELLAEKELLISGSSQRVSYNAVKGLSIGKKGSSVKLGLRRGEETLEASVEPSLSSPVPERSGLSISEDAAGIFYVDLTRAGMTEITENIGQLAAAKGVIFDLRGYPKENITDVLRYLTDDPVQSAIFMVPQIVYPDREGVMGWLTVGWSLTPREPKLAGKIVFLTDAGAISYSETIMGIIEHYGLADIVGEPTAGTNGNVNYFTVPGNYQIKWTGMRVLKHDGSQHHLIGIQPTVPVSRTLKGVLEGRDEFLEAALELIGE